MILKVFKGTHHVKMTLPDLQLKPLKLCLIKYELDFKVYHFENALFFYVFLLTKGTCTMSISTAEKHTAELSDLNTFKRKYLPHY